MSDEDFAERTFATPNKDTIRRLVQMLAPNNEKVITDVSDEFVDREIADRLMSGFVNVVMKETDEAVAKNVDTTKLTVTMVMALAEMFGQSIANTWPLLSIVVPLRDTKPREDFLSMAVEALSYYIKLHTERVDQEIIDRLREQSSEKSPTVH